MSIKINFMELTQKNAQAKVSFLDLAPCSKPPFLYGAQ